MSMRQKIEELALMRATGSSRVNSGCVGGWLLLIGGHEGWSGAECGRRHATGTREKDLAGTDAFLERTQEASGTTSPDPTQPLHHV
jgi:hypothetical protein